MPAGGLFYEVHGEGAPILCIHGAGSSARAWEAAVRELAGLGRVIAYDRRGCSRSSRPEPYEHTSVAEHAADALALLGALDALGAVVIGRSYGGTVGLELAASHPEAVRAVVALEPDAPRSLAPETALWLDGVAERLRAVAPERVGEALIEEVMGEGVWPHVPEPVQRALGENGPAILAELRGEWWPQADVTAIGVPVLLVAAEDSRAELRAPALALADAVPGARLIRVPGGHITDPAGAEVLAFVAEVLDTRA